MARTRGRGIRAAIGAVAVAGALTLSAGVPAGAGGGDWLYPDRDRYEPGQRVTMVGYVQGYAYSWGDEYVMDRDWPRHAPFHAYLRVIEGETATREASDGRNPFVHPTDRRLGQVLVEEKASGLRIGVSFDLPPDLGRGVYDVVVCNDPCTMGLAELLESPVFVGIDPPEPIVRDWPLDEPLIRYLDDGAVIADPGTCADDCRDLTDWTVTAAEVRAGYQPSFGPARPVPPPPPPSALSPTTARRTTDPERSAAPGPTTPERETAAPDLTTVERETAASDPAGDLPGEVVAWLVALGVPIAVWCLAWRGRPQDARITTRSGGPDDREADREPEPVRIEL